jgi:hypothetical protein
MKKNYILGVIFIIANLLFSGTGARYEIDNGVLGKKVFEDKKWRNNWTVILPINVDNDGVKDLFFYDPITGQAESYKMNNNSISLISKYKNFRKSWKNIIPVDIDGNGTDELLFYDPKSGQGEMYKFDGKMSKRIQTYSGWRKNWKTILSINIDDDPAREILLYDPDNGVGEILEFDHSGNPKSLNKFQGWRKNWQVIREVNINYDTYSDLMFYDQDKGQAEFYTFDSGLKMKKIKSHNGWRKNWRTVVSGNFGSGIRKGDLFFYDPRNGEAEWYKITKDGNIKRYGKDNVKYRSGWDIILSGRFSNTGVDGMLLYDSPQYIQNFKQIFGKKPY